MSYCEENRFQPKLICGKGDMLLSEIKNFNFNTRSYNLAFTIQVPNSNVASLTGFEIYDLLEAQNKELIEKIIIPKRFFKKMRLSKGRRNIYPKVKIIILFKIS